MSGGQITMKSSKFSVVAIVAITASIAMGAGKSQTFTGEVSDAMCGVKHMMPGNAACARACVKKGTNYALVIGDKVYTLHTEDKSALEQLDKLAGEKAKVTGVANGETIEVSKVVATKE
jgi:hypothetical protein